MTFEEIIFKILETGLGALGMFLMYRIAILALQNGKTQTS